MTKFDKIAKYLGWIQPYEKIGLYYKEKDSKYLKAVIDIGNYSRIENVDKEYVKNTLEKWLNKNIFEKENSDWVLPMLASDYFAHKADFDNELVWAKKAMKENDKLTPLQFSSKIREQL